METARIRNVCVFCGSSSGNSPHFERQVEECARAIIKRGMNIVYGGGKVGLMGVLASSALALGGHVIGVMPDNLIDREIAHDGLSELVSVRSMHERKAYMASISDAFLALPGGVGTLEEALEQWTWLQIGVHTKPIGFLNFDKYYNPLRQMVDQMVTSGFLSNVYRDSIIFETSAKTILEQFDEFKAPPTKEYST